MKYLICLLCAVTLAGCASYPKDADFQKSLQTCTDAGKQFHEQVGAPVPAEGLTATKAVTPEYPKVALRHRVEGCVALAFDLDETGHPANIKVLAEEPANRWFREAALDAFAQEEYPKVIAKNQTSLIQFRAPKPEHRYPAEAAKNQILGPNHYY